MYLRWCHNWCVGFFFFKQKTAYEMRISDWSSDVCSSDLVRHDGMEIPPLGPAAGAVDAAELRAEVIGQDLRLVEGAQRVMPSRRQRRIDLLVCVAEIGRASCRERVCQYV